MSDETQKQILSTPMIAIAGWVLPGAGYWLIGQRTRGLTVGITIIALFIAGLLIGGVRVLEVPGWDDKGERVHYKDVEIQNRQTVVVDRGWIITASPLTEIRNKPWSVPQVMAGPMSLVAAYFSVWAAGPEKVAPNDTSTFGDDSAPPHRPVQSIGEQTFSRMNEIPSLYCSVAGLLNLLVIIDSTWRASHMSEAQRDQAVTA